MSRVPFLDLSAKRRLLRQLELKRERGTLDREIAIVGLAGRYPQARELWQLWQGLKTGRISTSEIPADRWDYLSHYDPDPYRAFEGKAYCKWGGFLEGIREFDARFFNVPPKEAEIIDPQERLFLEIAAAALEDAGYARNLQQPRRTGVFVGVTTAGYPWVIADQSDRHRRMIPNGSFASIPNRVSYFFNFQGPSLPVDTMCSSSLTAVIMACESILRGECDSALAGGVNLYPHPSKFLCLSQMGIVSQDGKTRSFGKGGKGFVPGEGVGAVYLKPLRQAIKDGDTIYATILGGAINHMGKSSAYLAPNPQAQAALVLKALENARVPARTISYLEAQGLGAELVDAVEIAGLTRAFQQSTGDKQFCALGTLKPNLGHAESASGIAQLTKVLLQLRAKLLCPSVLEHPLNPEIALQNSPFYVQRELAPWLPAAADPAADPDEHPRRAAISAHGAGGSSAHLIVEEFENPVVRSDPVPTGPWLFPFSAKTQSSLRRAINRYAEYLQDPERTGPQDAQFLQNLAFTLQERRETMKERLAIVARSAGELKAQLEQNGAALAAGHGANGRSRPASIPASTSTPTPTNGEARLAFFAERAGDWVAGGSLPKELLVNPVHAQSVSSPTYAFEPDKFWVGQNETEPRPAPVLGPSNPEATSATGAPEPASAVGAAARATRESKPNPGNGPSPSATLEQHEQFFDSLQSFYRATVLSWFQEADLFEKINGAASVLPAGPWLEWLMAWLEKGRLIRRSGNHIELSPLGKSPEIQGQIQGLSSRRGLILRAIPELAPTLQVLDWAGRSFAALLGGRPLEVELSPVRALFRSPHRFAQLLEFQIQQCLRRHLPVPATSRANGRLRILELGLGSLPPLRGVLNGCAPGFNVELWRTGDDDLLGALQRDLAGSSESMTRRGLPVNGEVLLAGVEPFDVIVWRRSCHQLNGSAIPDPPQVRSLLQRDGLLLLIDDGEMDYFGIVFGHIAPAWIPRPALEPIVSGGGLALLEQTGHWFQLFKAGPVTNSRMISPLASASSDRFPDAGVDDLVLAPARLPANPNGEIELLVVTAVADVLGVDQAEIDVNAEFSEFALGSIMLAQVYLKLKSVLGEGVTPLLVAGARTVRELAVALAQIAPDKGRAPSPSPRPCPELSVPLDRVDAVRPAAAFAKSETTTQTAREPRALASNQRGQFRAPSGWEIEFFQEGNPEGPVILFLTAMAFTRGIWERQTPELTAKYRLVFPHLPGHAGSVSSPGGFSFASLADDLVALMDWLKIPQLHLVGWCMAGNISQVFARRHPERLQSLTLIGTTPTDARLRGLSASDLQTYSQAPLYTYEIEFQNLEQYRGLASQTRTELLDQVRRHFCPVDPGCIMHYLENLFQFDTRPDLPHLTTPTLVMAGEWDIAFPPEQVRLLAEGIPGARFHHFTKSGHMPFLTQPDLFNYLLEDFLQSVQ